MAKNIEGTETQPRDFPTIVSRSGETIDPKPLRDLIDAATWKKPSERDPAQPNAFVEVAFLRLPGQRSPRSQLILMREGRIRDDPRPPSPILLFTAKEWDAFTGGGKDDEFEVPVKKLRHKKPHLGRSTGWRPRRNR